MSHVKNLRDICWNKQSMKNRIKITISILILGISLIQLYGELGIFYMYMQKIFGYDLNKFTYLLSYSIVVNSLISVGGVWIFSTLLKCEDLNIVCFSSFFRIIGALMIVYFRSEWNIYVARTFAATLGLTGPLMRSFLSKVIPPDDLGKVFSLAASVESGMPLVASLTYSLLYNSTVGTHPQAVFLLSGGVALIMLLLNLLLIKIQQSDTSSAIITQAGPSINM